MNEIRTILLMIGSQLDVLSTYIAIEHFGAEELNPFVGQLLVFPEITVLIKLLIPFTIGFFISRLPEEKQKRNWSVMFLMMFAPFFVNTIQILACVTQTVS